MEGHKLDIAGRRDDDDVAPTATYKQIPEDDMEERELLAKNATKSRNSTPEADGADEKMLPEEDRITPNVTVGEVKFTSKEKQNGDAKLDIGELKSTFVGMGKEELMKYANDPFWVRLRWTLFILFWLLWAAMLVGAIVIIIGAPKCPRPQPRTWWEQGPLTEIEPDKTTVDDLKNLKEAGVKGVIADWPLDTYQGVEGSQEFVNFLKDAHSVEMPVIVGLEPAHSRRFFNSSEAKDKALLDYYLWANPKGPADNGQAPPPPNNWLSPDDKSAWVYSTAREQHYLAPFGEPQLNLRDERVRAEFAKVLTGFLNAGVRGIRVKKAPYMLVDEAFKSESLSGNVNFTVGQYNFYNHDRTMNSNDLGPLLYEWKQLIKNKTEDGLLMIAEEVTTLEPYKVNKTLAIDLPINSIVFAGPNISAQHLYNGLNITLKLLENKWPLWKVQNAGLNSDVIDMLTFMLPGSTLIPFNYTVNKELLKRRAVPSITHGTLDQYLVGNDTTYAFIRVISGSPGYLVAVNPTSDEVSIDFPRETNGIVSEDVTVDLLSDNYNVTDVRTNMKIKANAVKISPKAAVILTYQPKAKDA